MSDLIAHFNYLKRTSPDDYVHKVLDSKELYYVFETRDKSFCWKTGLYNMTFRMSSPRKFTLKRSHYRFSLTSLEVDRLRGNIATAKSDLKNIIRSNLPDFEQENISWYWANVNVQKVDQRA